MCRRVAISDSLLFCQGAGITEERIPNKVPRIVVRIPVESSGLPYMRRRGSHCRLNARDSSSGLKLEIFRTGMLKPD